MEHNIFFITYGKINYKSITYEHFYQKYFLLSCNIPSFKLKTIWTKEEGKLVAFKYLTLNINNTYITNTIFRRIHSSIEYHS